jgi:putative intracellular protease/amidase
MSVAMGKEVIHIGVFIPNGCQLLDQACVDIFGSISIEYLSTLTGLLPQPVIDLAPSVKIHYIGSVKAGETISLTSCQQIIATNHYSDPEVEPGNLDAVLVPGPDPSTTFESGPLEWLRKQADTQGTDILSVCTGIFLCGEAGLISGKQVCGPMGLQDMMRTRFKNSFIERGKKLRWVQDGNLWSSGESSHPLFSSGGVFLVCRRPSRSLSLFLSLHKLTGFCRGVHLFTDCPAPWSA